MPQWYLTLWMDHDDKIGALLQDPVYKKLVKTPQTFEYKTSLLLKKSTLAEEVCSRLHPTGSRPLTLYGLLQFIKRVSS